MSNQDVKLTTLTKKGYVVELQVHVGFGTYLEWNGTEFILKDYYERPRCTACNNILGYKVYKIVACFNNADTAVNYIKEHLKTHSDDEARALRKFIKDTIGR